MNVVCQVFYSIVSGDHSQLIDGAYIVQDVTSVAPADIETLTDKTR